MIKKTVPRFHHGKKTVIFLLIITLIFSWFSSIQASQIVLKPGGISEENGEGTSAQGDFESQMQEPGGMEGTIMGDEGSMENQLPIAIIDSITPARARPGETVTFTGHGEDADGYIIAWNWSSDIDYSISSEESFSTSTLSVGRHTISFTVTDDLLTVSLVATELLIINTPPLANAGDEPCFGYLNTPLCFDGSHSSDVDGIIVSYCWNFGDGTTGTGATPTHTYTAEGTYNVALTVTDDLGDTDTVVTTATIVGISPVANTGGPYYSFINQTIIFNGTKSTDLDGTIVSWIWDFGDGTQGTGVLCPHSYQENRTYIVTLTVTDNDGYHGYDTTYAVICTSNTPPTKPMLNLTSTGDANMTFTFSLRSFDANQDLLRYNIDWDDSTTTTSPLFPSGTILTVSHTWTTPGTYTITATATDESGTSSEPLEYVIVVGTEPGRASQASSPAGNPPEQPPFIVVLLISILLIGLLCVGVTLRLRRKNSFPTP